MALNLLDRQYLIVPNWRRVCQIAMLLAVLTPERGSALRGWERFMLETGFYEASEQFGGVSFDYLLQAGQSPSQCGRVVSAKGYVAQLAARARLLAIEV